MKVHLLSLVIALLALPACSQQVKRVIVTTSNMENTIMSEDEIEYVHTDGIKREDIVVFKTRQTFVPNDVISCFRVVAIPGDSILIDSNRVYVNGILRTPLSTEKRPYRIVFSQGTVPDSIRYGGYVQSDSSILYNMDSRELMRLKEDKNLISFEERVIDKNRVERQDYELGFRFKNGHVSFLDPIKIPKKGEVLKYQYPIPLIGQDNNKGSKIKSQYYFLLNDNFSVLPDSRAWGLYPADSLLGVVKKLFPADIKIYRQPGGVQISEIRKGRK